MTKVKICGITNLEDALLSAKFGADALGFNFYAKSPRYIAPEKAREIIEQLPQGILKVGVFVNESLEKIAEIASIAKLDALQLHGEETPDFARELKSITNLEIIKAFRVSPEFKPEDVLNYEVDAVLLDAYSPLEHGGTGSMFDWKITDKVKEVSNNQIKIYLAGGLSHNGVASAISLRSPYAVDACSKLEVEKGKKDKVKVINFICGVRNADEILENSKNAPNTNEREILKTIKEPIFYNMMKGFQTRPQMYFGKKSLTLMMLYLQGFDNAAQMFGIEFENGFYPEISNWVREKLNVENKLSLHYSNLILEECDGDEEKAFDLFFALLEEFKLEKEDLSNE